MKGGKISITTANGVVVRWGAGLDGYCCDRLYLCSCITADAGSQSHFIHVGKSHPFPEAVAAVTCQSHCANSARQLWWIEGQHCLGRWSIKNKPKNVKVVLKSLGMKKKKKEIPRGSCGNKWNYRLIWWSFGFSHHHQTRVWRCWPYRPACTVCSRGDSREDFDPQIVNINHFEPASSISTDWLTDWLTKTKKR